MNKKTLTKLFAVVLMACVLFSLAIVISAASDNNELVATFELGANGSTTHADGSSVTSYTETDGDYTLSITNGAQMYKGARDAKGNSCLKFGSSKATGSMSMTVPDDVTSVIIYVAKYKSNTSKITVNGTTYTISGASNNGAYDAITVDTTATKKISFSTVSGSARVMVNTIEFYTPKSGDSDCAHTNTKVLAAKPATCTTAGLTEGSECVDCGAVVVAQTSIPATGHGELTPVSSVAATCIKKGSETKHCAVCDQDVTTTLPYADHNFVDGTCSVCNAIEAPVTGVPYKFGMFQGNTNNRYYITGSMSSYYMATTTAVASGVNVYLEETEGGYYLYTFVSGAKKYINMVVSGTYVNGAFAASASTVYTYDTAKNTLTAKVNNSTYAFGTRADSTYTTVGPVKTSSSNFLCNFYAAGDVAKFDSASVTLGTDLGMNFKVTVPSGVPTVTVEFAGKTYTLTAEQLTETTYKFAFKGIGPHQMAENIKATLSVGGKAVAEINNYSVEKNLNAILAADASLANIVNAVLAYGNASEDYVGVEGGVAAPEATETVIGAEENKLALNNAKDFGFTAAGVNFDSANKIYVKFHVDGEFKFYVNGTAVEIEKTEDGNYKYYTNELTAKQLGDVFTFEIEVNGVKATLAYSVNTYAYAMQNDAEMSALVKALYAYGLAVKAYA